MNEGPVDWFGVPPGGWATRDDVRRLADPQLGISIRFVKQWRPQTDEELRRSLRLFQQFMYERARWHAALTDDDPAWLLSLGISPA